MAFLVITLLYATATGLYFAFLRGGNEFLRRIAPWTLACSALVHAWFLVVHVSVLREEPFLSVTRTLSFLSWLIAVVYLLALLFARKQRLGILGTFITPVCLLLFLLGGPGHEGAVSRVRSFLLPFHVSLNVLGVVAFALAFASALAYVIQERLLRKKKLLGAFERLPPLHILDQFGLQMTLIGMPLLTLGVITGVAWATRNQSTLTFSPQQWFAVATWLIFAGVLLMRVVAGWRGRRAAIGTIIGFACAMCALIGYVAQAYG